MTVQIVEQDAPVIESDTYANLERTLMDTTATLALRFRVLFTLKSLATPTSIAIIGRAFTDSSALLKHELAYVLGQMKDRNAIPILESVLSDKTQDPMVRHEAAEAMAAIGWAGSIGFLEMFENDDVEVVKDTVILALAGLRAGKTTVGEPERDFGSVDPAPAACKDLTTNQLHTLLLTQSLPLFERYQAMFALRNRGDTESVLILAQGFNDPSALFRHEIAYVFGQMQHEASVPSLIRVLSDTDELAMVRHEAAEALGSIATAECLPVLRRFAEDADRTVRDSCLVGLDMFEFEVSNDQHYAINA